MSEGLNAVRGNVLDEDLLDVAGISSASIFIAMTTNHEVNRMASNHARTYFGVPLVWLWPTPNMGEPGATGTTRADMLLNDPALSILG